MNKDTALGLARHLISLGFSSEDALGNSAIPVELRDAVRDELIREENITLEPAKVIAAQDGIDWLRQADRSTWHYWPALRTLQLTRISAAAVQSIDDSTDRILRHLAHPDTLQFDIRGLVLGYVQSGKTANYTATIAKAADNGYRLIIVLTGIDNGLRRQTQLRLKKELVGYPGIRPDSVPLPPLGHQWYEFTTTDLNGDFRQGNANQAALQGTEPVLLVVKKNGQVLRRLQSWVDGASEEVKRTIPVLVIDDEADLASIDTRGSRQSGDEPIPADYELPAVINGRIRRLLNSFQRKAYIAYTATPFANILIPHDNTDPQVGDDLYPRDFIVDLPKPDGYFGADDLFGRLEPLTGEQVEGLNVIRGVINENEIQMLESGQTPPSLENAILAFILAGAARAQRGAGGEPATMLIHVSQLRDSHTRIETFVSQTFSEFKNKWRYQKDHGIRQRLNDLWDSEFQPITRINHPELEVDFNTIEPFINKFFEDIVILKINGDTEDMLDYERDPALKAIAIGGNKLSRGLTLEGLLVSFFARPSPQYDTLMQMGRWFGFRRNYEDLTRIWTTPQLSEWFTDLALVEFRLREDLKIYEDLGITPIQVGMRISQHPTMQVTSPLKRRYGSTFEISQSYSCQVGQTFKFPFDRLDDLSVQEEANRSLVISFLSKIGRPRWNDKGPVWSGVPETDVLDFLRNFRQDPNVNSLSLQLICSYIEHQFDIGELVRWTVAVPGRELEDPDLGEATWGVPGRKLWQIARTKLSGVSIGTLTSATDESIGLSEDELRRKEEIKTHDSNIGEREAARMVRSPQEGLLLIYPISKFSGQNLTSANIRRPLFDNPDDPRVKDLIGLAVSFPNSQNPQPVVAYWHGSVGWRSVQ